MVRNIIFDMGGVLVDLYGQRCIDAFNAIGATEVAVYVVEHRTEDLFQGIEDGSITTEEFCNEARRLSPVCKAKDEDIIHAWDMLLEAPAKEKFELILKLRKKGYRIFLLSNTNDMHWQYAESELFRYGDKGVDDFFEQIFLSYVLHLQKPDTRIYQHVLDEARLKAEECLFIDDNIDNLNAAASVGIVPFHEREGNRWTEKLMTILEND